MQYDESAVMSDMSDHIHHQMTNEVKLTETTEMTAHDCCDANCECLLNASQSAISVPVSPAIQQPQYKSLWFVVPNLSLDHITDRIDRPPIFA
ncbi:hypothetical protein [Marinicella meishanensis]|uniref:hypothetical protein n=1 Tax=Marinicella meishanensis TaxID=2873263 RepID=UPI001CBADCFF|nr:hypothetical protein [Marinicella sp. NBU2979]